MRQLQKKKKKKKKKINDDVMPTNCEIFVNYQFIATLEQSRSRISEVWSVKLIFFLKVTFFLKLKTELKNV